MLVYRYCVGRYYVIFIETLGELRILERGFAFRAVCLHSLHLHKWKLEIFVNMFAVDSSNVSFLRWNGFAANMRLSLFILFLNIQYKILNRRIMVTRHKINI